jgi:dCTP deaminase
MILTGKAIADCVSTGEIRISPFDHNLINPNSYDLRLGDRLLIYVNDILDPRQDNKAREIIIPREGYVLKGRHFYLGHSAEEIGSDHYVPMLHCKSGIARLGLFIHVTADLIDIGSHGNLTLQPASDS